ncbi:LuxR family two component transcriptional regulator [Mucilaginibacter gracilis]|uniref:LuxR family two component transcriptional regulator n=1 Tax=Mucilaginibacter gracilis TaxID=423350 RepID=A0A495J406_9SPHI|nr:response regulator transcription factor [Mucilaginibacter gracilis]RKR83715.1 LuxR family two component transcriptional regulator [Mucilaginibacter gracilis]
MSIKVAVVDDQNIFRQSLCFLIESIADFELVASAADGDTLLATLATLPLLPDVLLMDMSMPGMDGIELNTILNKRFPTVKVIVLSVHGQNRLISKMISAGAAAYLVKNCDRDELITAIKTTYTTGYYMNKQVLVAIQEKNRSVGKLKHFDAYTILTDREIQVLEMICNQYASAEIAEKLFISARTVEGHRNNLLLKTQSRNTAGLVLFAIKHQLFTLF